jgi:DNA polymerase-3 subunit gamma/tau
MVYQPLHHKYRPQTFANLVGQETIASTLTNAIEREKIAPAYLFTGPRGTGKTSSARILAKSLNCLNSSKPTPNPCGKCEVCRAIASGTALDIIEIDAASNTGVDNIREIIERSRFAPVQCRYKVYAIDECLTGDSLVQTSEGLMRIDDPHLKGKMVLSYNENTETWEYKKVLRWLERGTKETILIKTNNCQIRCTKNHLIRTETGWLEAQNVKEGIKILSPANVDVKPLSTNLAEVESVHLDGENKVYDLEVEDNHNFVANGLLVHNCHMLSTAAFNALLKTLEEPPTHVVFILATTDPQRVLSTIISRCQRFDYRRIPLKEMTAHLKYIATEETIAITDEAITLIAQIANGGLRDAESLLDQLSLLPDTITVEKVWDLVGAVAERDLLKLLQAIRCDRATEVLQQCRSLLDRGREPLGVLQNLASFYLNLLIAKTAPDRPELVAITETGWQQLCQEASQWELPLILQGQQKLKEAEIQLKQTTQPRLWLEVTLLGLLPAANVILPPSSQKLAKVEEVAVSPAPTITKSEPVNHKAPVPPSPFRDVTPETPTTSQNTPPKVERSQVEVIGAIANSTNHQEIWQQVIDSVRSRMTQTLLSQQCHLMSFEDSRAIVGISNAKLRTLHQGKVADIEAAFAKVCQRQIKVQLEVATAHNQDAITSSVTTNNSQLSPKESAIQHPVDRPTQPEDRQEITPVEKPNTIKNGSKITPSNSDRDGNNNNIISPPLEKKTINSISQVTIAPVELDNKNKLEPDLIKYSDRDHNLDNLPPSLQSKNEENFSLETTTFDNSTSDPELLQKAIEDLTQSFEGEVVQLDDKMQLSWQLPANQGTEVESSLNNESHDISSLSTHIKNRPDFDEYDDDF